MPLRAHALRRGQGQQGDGDRGGRDASHERCNYWPRLAMGQRQPSERGLEEHSWLQALLARDPFSASSCSHRPGTVGTHSVLVLMG